MRLVVMTPCRFTSLVRHAGLWPRQLNEPVAVNRRRQMTPPIFEMSIVCHADWLLITALIHRLALMCISNGGNMMRHVSDQRRHQFSVCPRHGSLSMCAKAAKT